MPLPEPSPSSTALVTGASSGIGREFARQLELEQVRVDVEAVVDLDARYIPGMVERRRGTVIVMSSSAGFQPLPGNGTYSASKAFALVQAEALAAEVAPYGVTVTAVTPGLVETDFVETSEARFAHHVPKALWTDPERVVGDALQTAERGTRSVIPGGLAIKAALGPNRFIPTAITMPVSRFLMRDELRRAQPTNGAEGTQAHT